MSVIKATDADFDNMLASNPNVIVKYYADWCGSCKLFAPKYKRISDKAEFSSVHFVEVNAEENPQARLVAKVSNLPFFATFKNGVLVESVAAAKEESVEKLINNLVAA